MKKSLENTTEFVNHIQGDYSNINDKMIEMNRGMSGIISFEQIQEIVEFKDKVKEKMEDYDNKFHVVLGDFQMNENENDIKANYKNKISNNDTKIDNEKNNKKDRKGRILNLFEINKRIIQCQDSKVNSSEFNLKNEQYKNDINKLNGKINDLLSNIYGINGDELEKSGDYVNNKSFSFVSKNEFDDYKAKTDEELKKIYEKIEELNKLYEKLFNQMKDKCTLNDLDQMKNLILENTQELFKGMKNKNVDTSNSSIEILQKNFKQLLELLAEKEERDRWLLARKNLGGYICASCENYLGILKDDTNRHIHWKKLPFKIKGNDSTDKLYKIGNGYSRLLRMINFDINGIPTLNPLEYKSNEYTHNTSSNVNNDNNTKRNNNSLNKSGIQQSNYEITTNNNNNTKEDNKTSISVLKSRNQLDNKEKKLPKVNIRNSTEYFEKIGKKMNNSVSSFNFISPRLTKNLRNNHYKFD